MFAIREDNGVDSERRQLLGAGEKAMENQKELEVIANDIHMVEGFKVTSGEEILLMKMKKQR